MRIALIESARNCSCCQQSTSTDLLRLHPDAIVLMKQCIENQWRSELLRSSLEEGRWKTVVKSTVAGRVIRKTL